MIITQYQGLTASPPSNYAKCKADLFDVKNICWEIMYFSIFCNKTHENW